MTLRAGGPASQPHDPDQTYRTNDAWPQLPTAGWGRRVVALLIDWWLALAISQGFFHGSQIVQTVVFAMMQVILVATIGSSIGHRLLGLQVQLAEGGPVGPRRTIIRTLLLLLVIPPVVTEAGGRRGLHDAVAGTVITHRG